MRLQGDSGDCLLGCWFGAFMLYGCGPSQVVAVVASPICGIAAGFSKIQEVIKNREFAKTENTERKDILKHEITLIQKAKDDRIKYSQAFLAGLIPFAGGVVSREMMDDIY